MLNFAYDIETSLLQGHNIIDSVYQPSIFKSHRKKASSLISLSHFTILTGKELILITEQEQYGAVCKYIPLNRIKKISFKEDEYSPATFDGQKIFILSVNFYHDEKISVLFSEENRYYIESLIKKCYCPSA
jgi:hypothetical protein